jgi:hypothetical protein
MAWRAAQRGDGRSCVLVLAAGRTTANDGIAIQDASRPEASSKDSSTQMPAFTKPGFQERQDAAQKAKIAALDAYRNRPPVDEAAMAARSARRQARAAAEAERRATAIRAKQEAADAKIEQQRRAVEALEAEARARAEEAVQARASAKAERIAERKNWTEEDRKAARDARYAARKARQTRR